MRSAGGDAALLLLLLVLAASPVGAQAPDASLAVTGRLGGGPTRTAEFLSVAGLEVEVLPAEDLVPTARFERWTFPFDCVGIGPCSNSVGVYSVGAKVRNESGGRLVTYAGAGLGYHAWSSEVSGMSVRLRLGVELPLAPVLSLTADLGGARLFELSGDATTTPQDYLLGVSGGLKLSL